MQHEDWHVLMQAYLGTALRRVHDAQSGIEADYWKRIAHGLKEDANLK